MREQAKIGMESGTEAEARCRATVWNWGLAGAFVAVVDILSDVYNTFVFSANFQGRRSDNLTSDSAHCAACRADFKDKTGTIVERKRLAIIDRRRHRTADRAAQKSTRLLLR